MDPISYIWKDRSVEKAKDQRRMRTMEIMGDESDMDDAAHLESCDAD